MPLTLRKPNLVQVKFELKKYIILVRLELFCPKAADLCGLVRPKLNYINVFLLQHTYTHQTYHTRNQ